MNETEFDYSDSSDNSSSSNNKRQQRDTVQTQPAPVRVYVVLIAGAGPLQLVVVGGGLERVVHQFVRLGVGEEVPYLEDLGLGGDGLYLDDVIDLVHSSFSRCRVCKTEKKNGRRVGRN